MYQRPFAQIRSLVGSIVFLAWACAPVFAQDLEPRRWTPMPVDTNVAAVAYLFTTGNLHFDPVLRIEDAEVELNTALVSYTHYFPLFGNTARIDAHVLYQEGRWEGLVDGVPTTVRRDGLADPVVRFSYHLSGSPALSGKEFMEYRQAHDSLTTVGFAFEARLPLGEYMDDKLINLGQNRFVLGPQLGVLHTSGPWSFELTGTALFFTTNDDFFGGNTLRQDPLYALQTHVVRSFANGMWLSAGVAYGWAGETEINGVSKDDERSNLLFGGSFGFRTGEAQGMRIGYLRGDTLTDVGTDTHSLFASWAIRF